MAVLLALFSKFSMNSLATIGLTSEPMAVPSILLTVFSLEYEVSILRQKFLLSFLFLSECFLSYSKCCLIISMTVSTGTDMKSTEM